MIKEIGLQLLDRSGEIGNLEVLAQYKADTFVGYNEVQVAKMIKNGSCTLGI